MKLVCINDEGMEKFLTKGQKYEWTSGQRGYPEIVDDHKDRWYFNGDRFITEKEYQAQQFNNKVDQLLE